MTKITSRCSFTLLVLVLVGTNLFSSSSAQSPTPQTKSYFQVKEDAGVWSFVDPQKRKFFSIGINCINPKDESKGQGRSYNGLQKHGGDPDKWSSATRKRLEDWNFNTLGAWSSLRGQPYVIELSLGYSYADVFAADFEKYVQDRAVKVLKELAVESYEVLDKDPLLIGCFTSNELSWGWGFGWKNKKGLESLFEFYVNLPPESEGKKAWADYLAGAFKNDWKKLGEVWDVKVKSRDDLLKLKKIAPVSPAVYTAAEEIANGFVRKYAERYFSITDAVMRKHLPHHLNLGCRLTPSNPAPVIEVAGKYCDVISFNIYSKDLAEIREELTRLHQLSKKPVMLTEYAFLAKHNRSGNTNKDYERVVVANDRERGELYSHCAEALCKLPFLVGFHWFQYFDEPSQGRGDGENCNFGFVDVEDAVYEDLARAATEANKKVLNLRQK
ncbi:hypothetical protein KIH39_18915 [Telmatocola sphagniphila]|uniref:Agarase n=1 Tax=Telmatocola sphagniphila TaxID=1123043 RepID=A0A8E6EWT1_9BACT|nr:hypothetical protein [Telmatocola sphagniphila]QVL30908.1 hypothetical protein KIH39_18915 [Telmatocola sphagniphila]